VIEKGNMTDAEYIAVLEKEIRKRDKKIDKLEVENECLRKDNHIFLEALILSKHKIFEPNVKISNLSSTRPNRNMQRKRKSL